MSDGGSRIGEVKLRLRVPGELEAEVPRLRTTVEREVLIAVVEALERRIHDALGARAWVRIRRLAVRWSLDASALAAPSVTDRLADELARDVLSELASQPAADRLRPRSTVAVAFTSPRHADAARLADAADGAAPAWYHSDAAPPPQIWDTAAATGPAELAELVRWLDRMERLEPALAFASPSALAAVVAASPAHAPLVALVEARRAIAATSPSGTSDRAAGPASDASDLSSAAAATATPSPIVAPPPITATATATETAAETAAETATATETAPQTAADLRPPRASGEAASRGAAPPPTSPSAPLSSPPLPPDALDAISVETRHAGLFYLAGRVLEIDLAEALWAAGIPEGDALAHIALAILDDADDPAWRWFGGAFDRVPTLPTLPNWALTEIGTAVQHSLGRRLLTFDINLTPDALSSSLDALASTIPHRLAGDLATVHLLSRCAAALAIITAARLRIPPSWPALHALTSRPGRLVVTPTDLRVLQHARNLSLDHRRAGLDHNPGRLAWLSRHLRLEFLGLESM